MLKLKKVAVTGGLSCGKSSVCRILNELGAYVISADEIVHQLLSHDTNLGKEVIKLLGKDILLGDHIDRSRVAQIVFREPYLLHELEHLLHPAVYEEIDRVYQELQNKKNPPPLFIAEIPLLFESEGEKNFECVIAVVADLEICFQRFQQKTRYDRDEFNERISNQLPLLEKATRADYVIMNSGSVEHLQETTVELYKELYRA
ncbi:MAG: dephospho-CoA kinase [Parachlamydiaceae bacterium]|nr:dephospho-CoA kinase [Parachlamydiaceae bacterium]